MPEGLDVLVGSIEVRKGEALRLVARKYKGHDLLNLRLWKEDLGEWFPSNKGFTVRADVREELTKLLSMFPA